MKEALWIIGHGLLGSAVRSHIQADHSEAEVFPQENFSWNDPSAISSEFITAVTRFSALAQQCGRYRIFWTAGRGIMSTREEDMRSETENFALFLRTLDADVRLKNIPGILCFSSSAGAVYAGSLDDVISEATAVAPTTPYGRGKLEQEALLMASAQPSRGILIARMSNLYGSGQSRTKKQGLLTHIARCMLTRTPIHIYVPFDTMRDYLHVNDAAADLVRASALVQPSECITKIIASEEPTTIAAIIGLFRRLTRRSPLLVTGTNSLGAAYPHRMRFCSTILTEARSTKRMSLLEGIAETFAYERLQYTAVGMPQ